MNRLTEYRNEKNPITRNANWIKIPNPPLSIFCIKFCGFVNATPTAPIRQPNRNKDRSEITIVTMYAFIYFVIYRLFKSNFWKCRRDAFCLILLCAEGEPHLAKKSDLAREGEPHLAEKKGSPHLVFFKLLILYSDFFIVWNLTFNGNFFYY